MRLLFTFLLFFPIPGLALTIPDRPLARVHDAADILHEEQRQALETKLVAFEQETTNQIVVATFPSLEGESLEDFSIRLAEKWKIGQEGKDNGIIVLIFPNDRLLRVEVGYGLEAQVPDAYASRIIEEKLKPAFRRGDFYGGIDAAVDALIAATRGVYEPEPSTSPRLSPLVGILPFIVFGLLFMIVLVRFAARKGGWRTLASGGGWTYGGSSSYRSSSGGSSGGGGSFGGGGASGSW